MNKAFTFFLFLLLTNGLFAQKNLSEEAQPIIAEGKLLFKSEMASWLGTDWFLENYKEKNNIGGYFSYIDKDMAICVFFSNAENPIVLGTISFDSTYDTQTAIIDLTERDFTTIENDLYQIRKITIDELNTNTDGLFKFYKNTNPNIVPLINGQEKKVYVLTGPQENGVVIFGNDYLLVFDKDNKLVSKKQLHKNIIPIQYGNTADDKKTEGTIHTHLPETGDLITATDICTLMLYENLAKWKTHNVVSEKYLNIWNCETNQLTVVSMKTVNKIDKDQKKRNKKKNK